MRARNRTGRPERGHGFGFLFGRRQRPKDEIDGGFTAPLQQGRTVMMSSMGASNIAQGREMPPPAKSVASVTADPFGRRQVPEDGAGGGLDGSAPNRAVSDRAPLEQERVQHSPVSDDVSKIWRIGFIGVVLTGPLLLLILRLLDMQVMGWQQYEPPKAVASGRNTVDDTTSWGVIVDRDGNLLAADRFTYRITATPKFISADDYGEIAQRLAYSIGVPPLQIENLLTENSDRDYLIIVPDIDFEQGQLLLAERQQRLAERDFLLEHIHIASRPRRFYPQGTLGSQILGFLNAERVPVLGVERYYRNFLSSDGVGLPPGPQLLRAELDENILRFMPSGNGKGLVLTIDRTIQHIIEEELRVGVNLYRAGGGTVIVMDPNTGAILGMANWPTFDGNSFEDGDPSTFTNVAISAQFEPGSVFKLITVAAALDIDAVEASTVFVDTGTIAVGEHTIQNSDRKAVGELTVADALAHSNNVITVQIAQRVGPEIFYDYVTLFGFGADTKIDLSGEASGQVRNTDAPNWGVSDLATNSFGQGIAVTPIQMISAVAAIANGGKLLRPYIVQSRIAGDYAMVTQPTMVHQVIQPETATRITELMVHVVKTGNQMAQVSGYSVAGKSGTAEIATEEGYIQDETIATFIGFAPADDPQIVVLVKLDRPDPAISRWAAYTATPIFSRIAHRLFEHLNIPPDAVRLSDESQSIFCLSAAQCAEMQSAAASVPVAEPSNR